MKSYEVLKRATEELGVKAVAAALKVSQALVYKWCEPSPAHEEAEQSGAKNPLDRVADLYHLTHDMALVNWLCLQAGGSFVPNAPPRPAAAKDTEHHVLSQSHGMLRDFTELLDEITESYDDDQAIDAEEADAIRQKWEDLKAVVEKFVRCCEQGHYCAKKKP